MMNQGLALLKDKYKELEETVKDKYQEVIQVTYALEALKDYRKEIGKAIWYLEDSGKFDESKNETKGETK
jgi:hypothetical protein